MKRMLLRVLSFVLALLGFGLLAETAYAETPKPPPMCATPPLAAPNPGTPLPTGEFKMPPGTLCGLERLFHDRGWYVAPGVPVTAQYIFDANRDRLASPHIVRAGQWLRYRKPAPAEVPPVTCTSPPLTAPSPGTPLPTGEFNVPSGQTLCGLERRFHELGWYVAPGVPVTAQYIFDANRDRLSSPHVVQAGQTLRFRPLAPVVPPGESQPPKPPTPTPSTTQQPAPTTGAVVAEPAGSEGPLALSWLVIALIVLVLLTPLLIVVLRRRAAQAAGVSQLASTTSPVTAPPESETEKTVPIQRVTAPVAHAKKRIPKGFFPVLVLFFINAAMSGSIGPRNAEIAQASGLDAGTFGLAGLGQTIGLTIVILVIAPRLVRRFGARKIGLLSALAYALATALPGLAGSLAELFAALLVFGAVNAPLDVAVNRLGTDLEERHGKTVLTYLEVGFNAGLLLAAFAGAWAAGRTSVFMHLGTVAVIGAVLVLLCWRSMPHGESEEDASETQKPKRGRVIMLCLIAGAALWSELAVQDWGTLLYHNEFGVPETSAGYGIVSFLTGFIVALAISGWLADRFGRPVVIRVGAVLFGVGMVAAMLAPSAGIATAMLCVAGLGIGPAHPLAISASGEFKGRGQAAVIAAGYIGLMAQKPIIGQLGDATSLKLALGTTSVVLALVVLFGAGAARSTRQVDKANRHASAGTD